MLIAGDGIKRDDFNAVSNVFSKLFPVSFQNDFSPVVLSYQNIPA